MREVLHVNVVVDRRLWIRQSSDRVAKTRERIMVTAQKQSPSFAFGSKPSCIRPQFDATKGVVAGRNVSGLVELERCARRRLDHARKEREDCSSPSTVISFGWVDAHRRPLGLVVKAV
jgi:hypothetical protein